MKRNFVIKKFLNTLFFLSAAILGSCGNNDTDPAKIKIPSYKTKVLWERGMLTVGTDSPPLIEGGMLYFPSDNIPGGGSSITKINLENGKVLWETEGLWNHNMEQLQKIDEYIYFPVETGIVYVLNDSDGKLAATIRLGNNATEARNNRVLWDATAVSGASLFWGSRFRNVPSAGLFRLNTDNIDFSKAPDEIQNIPPDLVWTCPDGTCITSNIISDNGTLYFFASSSKYYEMRGMCTLEALDTDTYTVLWNCEMPHITESYYQPLYYPLFINGKNLIVLLEKTISCYNKSTGEPVYENTQLNYHRINYYIKNSTLYNNRLFYTESEGIISINTDTGTLACYTPVEYVTFKHFQVNMGKVYFLTDEGLYVYNADNGKLIGMDKKFILASFTRQYDLTYKDTVILVNKQSYGNYLTAIQCE